MFSARLEVIFLMGFLSSSFLIELWFGGKKTSYKSKFPELQSCDFFFSLGFAEDLKTRRVVGTLRTVPSRLLGKRSKALLHPPQAKLGVAGETQSCVDVVGTSGTVSYCLSQCPVPSS